METQSFNSRSVRSTVMAVLRDPGDYEVLCLAIEIVSLQSDVVLFQDCESAVRHLRQCSVSATTPNRRWPDAIVLDAEMSINDSVGWLAELGAISGRPDITTPILLLAADDGVVVTNQGPRQPEVIVPTYRDGFALICAIGEALKNCLERAEKDRADVFADRVLTSSTSTPVCRQESNALTKDGRWLR